MSYFKLKDNDVFVNTIEAYPNSRFYIHSGTIYLNNQPAISGAYSDNILGVPPGFVSLFEYNVNREEDQRIYPFITKGGQKQTFKTISKSQWNTEFNYDGSVITGSYNLSASISRITGSECIPKLRALKSSFNHYLFWSRHFDYATYYDFEDYQVGDPDPDISMINIPSIFYGSSIKKGSISLKAYAEGSVVAEATDENRRGELIQKDNGNVIGTVLYDEGILLLTGSEVLASVGTPAANIKWLFFGYGIYGDEDGTTPTSLSASFSLDFQGVSQFQNMTVLAKAPEGMLNHSNNPTYLKRSGDPLLQMHTSSYEYIERQREVKNIVHSEQTDYEPPFQKETYISKICIYDEHKRLVGTCKLATPIRKTEAKEYLFKMKIDL